MATPSRRVLRFLFVCGLALLFANVPGCFLQEKFSRNASTTKTTESNNASTTKTTESNNASTTQTTESTEVSLPSPSKLLATVPRGVETTFLDELQDGKLWGDEVPNAVGMIACLVQHSDQGDDNMVTHCADLLKNAEDEGIVSRGGSEWLRTNFDADTKVTHSDRGHQDSARVIVENSALKRRLVLSSGSNDKELEVIYAHGNDDYYQKSAKSLLDDITLEPGWRTLLAGHSLGGAVTERLAKMIADKEPSAKKPYVLNFGAVPSLTGEEKKDVLKAVGMENLLAVRMKEDNLPKLGEQSRGIVDGVKELINAFSHFREEGRRTTAAIEIRVDKHEKVSEMTEEKIGSPSLSELLPKNWPKVDFVSHVDSKLEEWFCVHHISTYVAGTVLAEWTNLKKENDKLYSVNVQDMSPEMEKWAKTVYE